MQEKILQDMTDISNYWVYKEEENYQFRTCSKCKLCQIKNYEHEWCTYLTWERIEQCFLNSLIGKKEDCSH